MINVRLLSGLALPAASIILLCLGGVCAGAEENAANDDDPFREMREQMVVLIAVGIYIAAPH